MASLNKIIRGKAATVERWFAEMDGNLGFSLLGSTPGLEADYLRSKRIIRLPLKPISLTSDFKTDHAELSRW